MKILNIHAYIYVYIGFMLGTSSTWSFIFPN